MILQRHAVAFALLAVWLALSLPNVAAARDRDVNLQRRNHPTTTTYTQEKCYTKVASTKKKHVHTTTLYSTTTSTVSVTVKSTGSTTTVTPSPTTVTSTATASTTTTSTNLAVTDTFLHQVHQHHHTNGHDYFNLDGHEHQHFYGVHYDGNYNHKHIHSKAQVKRQAKAPSLLARMPVIKKLCKSYPQSVTCKELIEKVVHVTTTVSSPSTTTVTAHRPTSTATTTTTKTITSTVAPPDTQTTVATATSYAACQTNNVINKISGQYVFNIYPSDDSAVINTGPSNAASDCCVACQQAGCNAWEFFNADQVDYGNQCYMISDTTCPAPYEVDTDPSLAADEVGTFGNGACGQVQTIVRD
ncbi:hypothetical protein FA10DRAFT_281990 [Acaromyces ingoldii]|uniref:Apple domain-containing protein n=1 Tax=Acaromyces ingoldii TaxID=215250 RepID=A0A316YDF1_9BASI|nr:hypothetical protein FA10DRAFT_281990 [Acaromyces ingoldii]PWN87259.1 hypothetical protein FA10DRAFT_281990 [Acaromyces ingoldii]